MDVFVTALSRNRIFHTLIEEENDDNDDLPPCLAESGHFARVERKKVVFDVRTRDRDRANRRCRYRRRGCYSRPCRSRNRCRRRRCERDCGVAVTTNCIVTRKLRDYGTRVNHRETWHMRTVVARVRETGSTKG